MFSDICIDSLIQLNGKVNASESKNIIEIIPLMRAFPVPWAYLDAR